jgi:hypothetical protein
MILVILVMNVMFRVPEVNNKGKLFWYVIILILWKQTKIKFCT